MEVGAGRLRQQLLLVFLTGTPSADQKLNVRVIRQTVRRLDYGFHIFVGPNLPHKQEYQLSVLLFKAVIGLCVRVNADIIGVRHKNRLLGIHIGDNLKQRLPAGLAVQHNAVRVANQPLHDPFRQAAAGLFMLNLVVEGKNDSFPAQLQKPQNRHFLHIGGNRRPFSLGDALIPVKMHNITVQHIRKRIALRQAVSRRRHGPAHQLHISVGLSLRRDKAYLIHGFFPPFVLIFP